MYEEAIIVYGEQRTWHVRDSLLKSVVSWCCTLHIQRFAKILHQEKQKAIT